MTITVTRQHNGTVLSTVYRDRYYHKLYIGYTLKEAKADFRHHVKGG